METGKQIPPGKGEVWVAFSRSSTMGMAVWLWVSLALMKNSPSSRSSSPRAAEAKPGRRCQARSSFKALIPFMVIFRVVSSTRSRDTWMQPSGRVPAMFSLHSMARMPP